MLQFSRRLPENPILRNAKVPTVALQWVPTTADAGDTSMTTIFLFFLAFWDIFDDLISAVCTSTEKLYMTSDKNFRSSGHQIRSQNYLIPVRVKKLFVSN